MGCLSCVVATALATNLVKLSGRPQARKAGHAYAQVWGRFGG